MLREGQQSPIIFQLFKLPFRLLLLICLINVSNFNLSANGGGNTPLEIQSDMVDVGQHSVFFEDPNRSLSIDQVLALQPEQWNNTPSVIHSHGFSHSRFWHQFSIVAAEEIGGEWFLEIPHPLTDLVDVYILEDQQIIHHYPTGDARPFKQRPVIHRNFIIPIDFKKNQTQQVLISIESSDETIFSAKLWPAIKFLEHDQIFTFIYGIYYGIMLIMVLYNLCVFFATRDNSYLLYVLFVMSTAVFASVQHGYAFQFFWPNHPSLASLADPLSVLASTSLCLFFTAYFLNLKSDYPYFHKTMISFAIICAAIFPFIIFIPFQIALFTSISLLVIGLILIVFTSGVLAIKGETIARIFLLAWSCLIVGVFTQVLLLSGQLPRNLLSENSFIIGQSLEISLLAFALAIRINELQRKRIEAVTENKAKSEFLAKMSHEIRTPMTGILGMSELLQDSKLNDTQKHYNEVIHSSGVSLLSLINDILDYSKIAAGKMELEEVEFELEKVVHDTISIFSSQAEINNIELICDIKNNVPNSVKGDPSRLKQIIINLVGNAFKFTEQGQIIISVERQTTSETPLNNASNRARNSNAAPNNVSNNAPNNATSDFIKFSIKDSGIGISDHNQEKLFRDFSQADTDTNRKYGGTGLGLSICKQLAILMGGEIGVLSREGFGATFWFTVKLPATHDLPLVRAPNDSKSLDQLKGKNVFIIDDNPTVCDVLKNQCASLGIRTRAFKNPEEALAEIVLNHEHDLNSIDLIIVDIEMPTLRGPELLQSIQEKNISIPTIAMSSAHHKLSSIRRSDLGVVEILEKPAGSRVLLSTLLRALKIDDALNTELSDSETLKQDAKHAHILLVEDNKTNQLVISSMLKRLNHTFEIADDGKEAVNILESDTSFDLVLMDYEMPFMNGPEAAQMIRQLQNNNQDIYIIALTAHAGQNIIEKCQQAGMNDYLSKPIELSQLGQKISQSINR